LITNSLKHGFKDTKKGNITIELNEKNNNYEFIYKDNGCGINSKNKTDKRKKFGNRLIKSLAEEIKATYEIKNENGLAYIFKFKKL